jgi:hypothetical protein
LKWSIRTSYRSSAIGTARASLELLGRKRRAGRYRNELRSSELIEAFRYADDPPSVIVDLSRAHLWDASAIAALDAIEAHYHRHGVELTITGLNDRSDRLHQTLSGQMAATH